MEEIKIAGVESITRFGTISELYDKAKESKDFRPEYPHGYIANQVLAFPDLMSNGVRLKKYLCK